MLNVENVTHVYPHGTLNPMLRVLVLAIGLAASACASAPAAPACGLPEADRVSVDRALEAWRFTSRKITGIDRMPPYQVILFSADCVLRSANALSSATAGGVTWTAAPHTGTVALPDGSEIRAGVISFARSDKGVSYFVTSTPSVWKAAGIHHRPASDTSMVAVLLHEATHVAQIPQYRERIDAVVARFPPPASFSDNSLQERFGKNAGFAASVKEETRLFLEAAAAKDDAGAERLAREARRLMRERQARWLVGDDTYLAEAEDICLTFEGAAQWTGYQWSIHPRGGAQPPAEVMARFTRGRWWSQTEGFAIVMALDRLAGPQWKRQKFGHGARTVIEMLDDALDEH